MLQVILRNRVLFLTTLATIWILIFLVPRMRSYWPNSQEETDRVRKERLVTIYRAGSNSNKFQRKPIVDIPYAHGGSFYQGELCLDSLDVKEGGVAGLWVCHDAGKNQFWFVLKDGLLKNKDLCLEGPEDLKTPGQKLLMQKCNENKEHQSWKYELEKLSMSGSELCLEAKPKEKQVIMTVCNPDLVTQKWKLKVPAGI